MKDSGKKGRDRDLAICKLKTKAFMKGLLYQTIGKVMEHKSIKMEISTKENIRREDIKGRVFINGQMEQTIKVILSKDVNMDRELGNLKLGNCILDSMSLIKNRAKDDTSGKMDASTMGHSSRIKSKYLKI